MFAGSVQPLGYPMTNSTNEAGNVFPWGKPTNGATIARNRGVLRRNSPGDPVVFASCATGVGNNPQSVPFMLRPKCASRYKVRPNFVFESLQVGAYLLEIRGVFPVHKTGDVLGNDPSRSNNPGDAVHIGPKVFFGLAAFALPGC